MYVVPNSDLPLLVSLESITAAFIAVNLISGIVRWKHDPEIGVQLIKGETRHWLLPLYCEVGAETVMTTTGEI